MKRKQLIPISVVSFALALVILLGSSMRANASVAPLRGYQQVFPVSLISDIATIRGAQPGYVVACAENNKLYFAKVFGSYTINPPSVINGQDGIIWVDLVTAVAPITSGFLGTIPWSIVTGTPTTGSGYGITDLAPKSRNVTTSGPLTVNGATSATLANDLAFGVNYGTPSSEVVGGSNAAGTATSAARSDHVHALPAFGNVAGTFTQGNDARLSDDRTASGMRTATTVVSSNGATAPSAGMVYQATSSTAASWALIGNGSVTTNSLDPNKLSLGPTNYVVTSNGSSNLWSAMSDAIHGNRGGGSLHSAATTSSAGFMTPADKGKLDGIPNAATTDYSAFLTPSLTVTGQYTLVSPYTLGYTRGSGAQNYLPKYTGAGTATALGASIVTDPGNGYAIQVGTAWFGNAFSLNANYKHLAIGTSHFDGTNWITPQVGSNTLAEMIVDGGGITFLSSASTGATDRTESPATVATYERFRIHPNGVNVAGKISIVGAYGTGDDTIPALGYGGTKFSLTNGGGSGLYGLLGGVLGNGNVFLQSQRVDGTATAYNLLLQPNGGNVGFGLADPSAAVDTTTFRMRNGASAGYLMTGDANGVGSWNSISGLGLMKNGATHIYLSDFLTLSSIGDYDINGGTLGYETQNSTGNVKDINVRAQSSTIGNGGNVLIYSGTGVTPSVDGVITLNSGTSGTGTINLVGNRIVGPSGIVYRRPQTLDAVTPTEDVQWTSLNSTGNTFVTIWFYGMDGLMTIDSGVYSFVWTVMARSVYFTTTAIYEATWTKSGSLTNNDSATIANPQGIALATGTSGGWVWLTAAPPPGIGSSIVTRWDVKTQIIKH